MEWFEDLLYYSHTLENQINLQLAVPIQESRNRRFIEDRWLTITFESECPKEYGYYLNGLKHRNLGPANIRYYDNGMIVNATYYKKNLKHRSKKDNQPAEFYYNPERTIITEVWLYKGFIHRLSKPAIIHYYDNGSIRGISWFNKNIRIPNDGILQIEYDLNGNMYKYREFNKYEWTFIGTKT